MRYSFAFLLVILLCPAALRSAPLVVNLDKAIPVAKPAPIGPGTTVDPEGHSITADSRSLYLDGVPWIPVCGEFHYARYPRDEWREELLKMKAGGIDVVSTYVFWIFQEEVRGEFDWRGRRSLRAFLELCRDVGLKAIVRLGPWCHGEVRNGGFPDWVEHSGTKLRTTDPAFLALVKPLYAEEAEQMKGLLWKDGGPVIGVQLDNECHDTGYLLALKKMARADGIDVPFYTMTGWNRVPIPRRGLLPVFGAYADGFWGGTPEKYRKSFLFSPVRDDGDLGAEMQNLRPARNENMELFPYLCAEIGPGMMSSYAKRIKIDPDDVAAMALVKLGSGNNMPGYYMYQGGTNPDGKLTTLQERSPNAMPEKDYDFQTALGAAGQVRRQYHLLREQHLFLHDFGPALARMPVYFPQKQPSGLKDFTTLRWSVRANRAGSGFIFFNNREPVVPLPDHDHVQFRLQSGGQSLLVPAHPVRIPSGAYGFWPVRLNCGGVIVEYATVQPLCQMAAADGDEVYFFAAIRGIRSEIKLRGQAPKEISPGLAPVLATTGAGGRRISFVVLTPEQALEFYRERFAGMPRAILSGAPVYGSGRTLHLQTSSDDQRTVFVYPAPGTIREAGRRISGTRSGLFERFTFPVDSPALPDVSVTFEKAAGPEATQLRGNVDATWKEAARYRLTVTGSDRGRELLRIHYVGDAARLYVGGKLFLDNFYNGDPFVIPLWRIPVADRGSLHLEVLPYSDALSARLPASAKRKVAAARAAGTLGRISISVTPQIEVELDPDRNR